ncbi:nitroreductase family deazaflavin-dependent oxidoreductase [Dactylosporangium sp. CA-052675]|uniref:nitroreductase family deazaflavin-dependent oxidoreductase n=1 Tax=Dactylosporangium sp. CA-052675 TaxID=3239927 RepID=UPI003D8A2319
MGLMKNLMIGFHKRTGDRFAGMDLLYITTVGAKSGKERVSPVARFADGDGAWLVVASNNGADRHPAWYHNLKAHPDQVWIEHGGHKRPATPQELTGERREAALQRIVAAQPRFAGYLKKTSRTLPVIRLSA